MRRCAIFAVLAAALNRVLPHLVDVEEEVLLVARRDVENRIVGRHRIIDRLPEMPFLRLKPVGRREADLRVRRQFKRRGSQ